MAGFGARQLSTQIYPSWQVFKDLETYRLIDDISSVVNRLADTAAKIPLYAYNKAGEDLPDHNKLSAFLASLTYYQRLEMFTFLYIFEECFIYTTVIDYGPNAGVKSMHMLHPNHVTVVVSDEFPASIIGFIYRDPQKGYEVKLLQEEVIFIRGINPTTEFYQKWRGLSRITLLSKTLTRLSANMSNSVAQMAKRQGSGDPDDKQADWDIEKQSFRESKMLSFFTNPANKALPYSASGDMGFLPIGSSLVDLDSAELAKIDLKKDLRGAAREQRVIELLKMVELDPGYAGRYPAQLSGGQRQRVAIARALAANPDLIICDEITSALDQLVQAGILQMLADLQQRLGVSYLFITHDLEIVRAIADRVIVMSKGRIVDQGSRAEVLSPPYPDYTKLLLDSVPEMAPDWLDRLLTKRSSAVN